MASIDKMVNTSDESRKRKETPSEDIAHEEDDNDKQLTLSPAPSTSSISSVRVNSSKLCKVKQPRLEDASLKQNSFLVLVGLVRRSEVLIFVHQNSEHILNLTFVVHIPKKMPPKSILFCDHFVKGSEGAKCNLCQPFIDIIKNTTKLRYLLQRKHPDICDTKMVNTSDESRKRKETPSEDIAHEEDDNNKQLSLSPAPSTSSISSVRVNSPKLCKVKQPRLEDAFLKQKSFLVLVDLVRRSVILIFVHQNSEHILNLTFVVHIPKKMPPKSILWKHFLPIFLEGSEGAKCNVCQQFIKTCGNTTNLRYHLQQKHPDICDIKMVNTSEESRKPNVGTLLSEDYVRLTSRVKQELSNADNIAFTTDIWTLDTKTFLGVTAHYYINCNNRTVMIGVTELDDRHTSDNLKEWLLKIVKKWNITLQSIVVVVSNNNNASNIKKAIVDAFGEEKHLGCYAHTLNLVVAKIIEEDEIVNLLCKKVKSIVTFFKKSVILSDLWREHSDLKLCQSVEARWNSTFDMLHRFIKLSDKIGLIILQHPTAPSMLSALELQTIKEFMQLLEPFKTATTIFSGELYTTGSQVIPIIHTLANQLESCKPTSEVGCHMKEVLTQEFQKRFKNIEQESLIAIATILDPRFKEIHFSDRIACCHAVNKITNILNIANKANVHKEKENNFQSQPVNQNNDFWAYYEKYISSNSANSDMPDEFRYYLNQMPINITEFPFRYWQSYPHSPLADLAKRYLTVIATPVPFERVFSRLGDRFNSLRNQPTAEKLQFFLFITSQLPESLRL